MPCHKNVPSPSSYQLTWTKTCPQRRSLALTGAITIRDNLTLAKSVTELTSSAFEVNRLALSATEQTKSNLQQKAANSYLAAMIKIHVVDETFYPPRCLQPANEPNRLTHLFIQVGGVMDKTSHQRSDHATMPSKQQSRCRQSSLEYETRSTRMMHISTLAQLNQLLMKDMFSISLTKWILLKIKTYIVLVVLSNWQLNVSKQVVHSRVRPCHWPTPCIKQKLQLIDSRETQTIPRSTGPNCFNKTNQTSLMSITKATQ